jgi:hypothetical protein
MKRERTMSPMAKLIAIDTVTARLYDGREIVAKVAAIVDSVTGRKIHIAFAAFALKA